MKKQKSAMPELLGLKEIELKVYNQVLEHWPSTPFETHEQMNEDVLDR